MATAAKAKIKEPQVYTWNGTNKAGAKVKGEMSGTNPATIKASLRKQGIVAKTVKKKPKPLFERKKPIKPVDIAIFTRQLATMMKAGVPLVQSFEIVAEGIENPTMRELVMEIRGDVAAGGGLAPSLAKHPRLFDDLFVNLIASGEDSGQLETMLDRVATYKEKSEALKAKIKKAMTYPIAVIVVAIVVTGILLVKVVPQFAETFSSFGADLPAFTLFVLGISEFAQAYWWIIGGAIVAAIYTHKEMALRSQKYSDTVDALMLKAPVVGDILNNAVVARFARTLSTTFAAGVPLVDALDSTAGAAANAVYTRAIRQIKDEVTTGNTLTNSIKNTGLFPILLIQMTQIGEESGALDEMLSKVADHYETAVDDAVDNMTALLEPLIMSVLGILVGGLLVAMYLPIFMLGSVV